MLPYVYTATSTGQWEGEVKTTGWLRRRLEFTKTANILKLELESPETRLETRPAGTGVRLRFFIQREEALETSQTEMGF